MGGILGSNLRRASQWHLFFLYINFFLNLTKGVLVVPLYLTYMEPRLYGAWLACGSIIGFLGLFDLGISRVMIQKVAACAASSKIEQLASTVSTGILLGCGLSVSSFIVGMTASPFIPHFVQISGPESLELRNSFIIGTAAMSLMLLSFTPASVLQGLQRQILVNVCYTGGLALGVGTTIVLLFAGYGLISIPLGTLVHAAVTAIGDYGYLLIILKKDSLFVWKSPFQTKVWKDIFSASSYEFTGNAAGALSAHSDNVIIAAAINPETCTVFTFTGMAHKMSATLAGYISHASMPSLAHIVGEGDRMRIKRVAGQILKYTTVMGALLLSGALVLNETVVRIWVGPEFYGGILLNAVFFASATSTIFFSTFRSMLAAFGDFRTSGTAVAIQACVQVPLMVVLGYVYGITGLALASLLSILFAALPIQAGSLIRKFQITSSELMSGLQQTAFLFAVPLGITFALRAVWNPSDLLQLVVLVGISTACALAVYTVFVREIRELILSHILGRC
jgi:O-antigen/teichoic acid export membrane protein